MADIFQKLLLLLSSIFGSKKPVVKPNEPPKIVSSQDEPAVPISPRVLVINIDPLIDPPSGLRLFERQKWKGTDEMVDTFIADILETSGGLVRYQVVQRIEADQFPIKADGFLYTPQAYLDVLAGSGSSHTPDLLDYQDFLKRYDILNLVASNQIDEVWAFGFPYAGFYESTMAGVGAFFCNSQPIANTASCPRRFVIMGFSNERGPGEMLHSFGHRAESIMQKVYARTSGEANLWQKFIRYDKTSPGKAQVGTIHFAPNSEKDYDYTNTRVVPSACDDWYNFPNFKGEVKQVNSADWGSDIYSFTKWWLKHLPKVGGRINGISNNWWQYIVDPNRVAV